MKPIKYTLITLAIIWALGIGVQLVAFEFAARKDCWQQHGYFSRCAITHNHGPVPYLAFAAWPVKLIATGEEEK